MKRLKKIKIIFVVVAIIGSLSLINCYATESKTNNIENVKQNVEIETKNIEKNMKLKITKKIKIILI